MTDTELWILIGLGAALIIAEIGYRRPVPRYRIDWRPTDRDHRERPTLGLEDD